MEQMEELHNQPSVIQLYLEQGWPINRICRVRKMSYGAVRKLLEQRGIPIRGRGSYTLRGSSHPSAKVAEEELIELESELLAGCPHGELAEKYGVSRERIRQIGKRIGSPTGRDLQMLRRVNRDSQRVQVKRDRLQERKENREARYAVWRDMWLQGFTAAQIAGRLGLKPTAVSVRIVNLRKQFPDWFPHRRKSLSS